MDVSLFTSAERNQEEKIYENTKLIFVLKYILLSCENQNLIKKIKVRIVGKSDPIIQEIVVVTQFNGP